MFTNYASPRVIKTIEYAREHDHVCLLYKNKAEQLATVVPFIKAGLDGNEQCLYVADENTSEQIKEALSTAAIDVQSVSEKGQLSILGKQDTYLEGGGFDPNRMIDRLEGSVREAETSGYTALRATGEMTWVLGEKIDAERLLLYEAQLNVFYPDHPCLGLCQYNYSKFPAEIIRDVIYTHPKLIINGLLCENIFYRPPEELLEPSPETEVERMVHTIYTHQKRGMTS